MICLNMQANRIDTMIKWLYKFKFIFSTAINFSQLKNSISNGKCNVINAILRKKKKKMKTIIVLDFAWRWHSQHTCLVRRCSIGARQQPRVHSCGEYISAKCEFIFCFKCKIGIKKMSFAFCVWNLPFFVSFFAAVLRRCRFRLLLLLNHRLGQENNDKTSEKTERC